MDFVHISLYLFSRMTFKRKFRVYLILRNRPKFAKIAKICTRDILVQLKVYLLKYPALVHVLKNIHEGQYISAVYLLKYPALVYIMKNICQGQYISAVYLLKYPALLHVLKNIYEGQYISANIC